MVDLDAESVIIVNGTSFRFDSLKNLYGPIHSQVMKKVRYGSASYKAEGKKVIIDFFNRRCLGEVGVLRDENALRQWKSGLDQNVKISAAQFFSSDAIDVVIVEDIGTVLELNTGFGDVKIRFDADKATLAKAFHQVKAQAVKNSRGHIDYLRWFGGIRNLFAEYFTSIDGVAGLGENQCRDVPSHWMTRSMFELQNWSWEVA